MKAWALGFVVGGLLLGERAWAQAKDAQAEKALKQALDVDYLETRFDVAEQRLRAAIQACGKEGCSPKLVAKLHAALGSVLAGGKKELEDARDAFVDALSVDPEVEPDADITSSEVTFAFEQAKKKLGLSPGKPVDTASPPAPKKEPEAPKHRDEPKDPDPPKPPVRKNWVSVAFVPDVSIVSGTNVCTEDGQNKDHHVCLREDRSRYAGTPTRDNADNVNTGLALSTLRIVLGYDRLVLDNLTVGARIGLAFNGATDGGAAFIPVHAEARIAWFPGKKPFEGAIVRPSIFASGGLAQIDTKVEVQVLEDGATCGAATPGDTTSPCTRRSADGVLEKRQQKLLAYKQAGPGFAALGFGVDFVPQDRVALHLGARVSVTFPVVTAVISPEAGLGVGF